MTCCSVGLGGKWRKKSGRNNGRRKLGRELQGAQRYKTTRLLLVWIQCRSISNQPCEQAVHVGGWGGGSWAVTKELHAKGNLTARGGERKFLCPLLVCHSLTHALEARFICHSWRALSQAIGNHFNSNSSRK